MNGANNFGRRAGVARILRVQNDPAKEKYKRLKPTYSNKVLQWVSKNIPEYAFVGNAMPADLKLKIRRSGMNPTIYKRILLNECIVTLDELFHLSKIFGCKIQDLI